MRRCPDYSPPPGSPEQKLIIGAHLVYRAMLHAKGLAKLMRRLEKLHVWQARMPALLGSWPGIKMDQSADALGALLPLHKPSVKLSTPHAQS